MNGKATESISGCMEIYKKTAHKKLFISVTLVWNYKNTMTHYAKQVFFFMLGHDSNRYVWFITVKKKKQNKLEVHQSTVRGPTWDDFRPVSLQYGHL